MHENRPFYIGTNFAYYIRHNQASKAATKGTKMKHEMTYSNPRATATATADKLEKIESILRGLDRAEVLAWGSKMTVSAGNLNIALDRVLAVLSRIEHEAALDTLEDGD